VQTITELVSVLQTQFSNANLQNFAIIIDSILSLSRPVTTLSVARISSLSYRTIHRFYALENINWYLVNLILFKTFIYQKNKVYLLAADETVEDKAGKSTYGIGRFYSSTIQKVIKSVSFLAMVIIDVDEQKSHFITCHQLTPTKKTPVIKEKKQETVKKKGRPKGSKNKIKEESTATSYITLKSVLRLVMSELYGFLPDLKCFHLVLDGFYGHEDYLLLALSHKLNIISKFKHNAHLILPYEGKQSGRGRRKTKGDKVDISKIDSKYFVETISDIGSNITTDVYKFEAFTPKITKHTLNVVVLIHTHQISKKISRTILFSSDLDLTASNLINYYSLRFQIEFDFRDAKQFYGLSDFKNYKETTVTNAVNLSFSMTLISKIILKKYKERFKCERMGTNDLKAIFKIQKHAEILFNDNKTTLDDFLNSPRFLNLARLEAIHV
jgi:putative transposase